MTEVVLGQLLDIGWVTVDHTTLLSNYYNLQKNPLFRVGISYLVDGLAQEIGALDHISFCGHVRSKMPKMMQSIYG